MDLDKQIDMLVCTDNKKAYNALWKNTYSKVGNSYFLDLQFNKQCT